MKIEFNSIKIHDRTLEKAGIQFESLRRYKECLRNEKSCQKSINRSGHTDYYRNWFDKHIRI